MYSTNWSISCLKVKGKAIIFDVRLASNIGKTTAFSRTDGVALVL